MRKLARLRELTPDPGNANRGTERGTRVLEESLRECGAGRSIVTDRNGVVIAGNKTLERAAELGLEVEVVASDGKKLVVVQRTDLDLDGEGAEATRARRLAYYDNRSSQVGLDWDVERIAADVEAGIDLRGIFEPYELEDLGIGELIDRSEGPAPQLDRAAELLAKWQVERGQVWEVPSRALAGRSHRLACGDATSAEDVGRLMGGERAALFATDPPYLVGYDGTNHPQKWNEPRKNKDWSEDYADWDDPEQGEALYDGFIQVALDQAIAEDAAWYCWHASRNQALLERVWAAHGAFVHQQIIWVKDRPILTRSHYMWQHEPCFFGWRRGHKPRRRAENHPTTVWAVPTIAPGTTTDHPTSKPVRLFEIPIEQHTDRGELCYEPFAGSGTQFVAAEKLARRCYGLDSAPQFVAVTLQRLADMGLEPRLVGTVGTD